MDTQKDTRIKV